MTDNLRHWSALERTDPAHTKPFDRGRFKGTATKPIWNERHMTEHFGPCGLGWGMDKPEFSLVPAGNELTVFCTVALWYKDGEATGTVYGVGGDKVIRVDRNGPFVSDEAYKAAFTDALGNAMKRLGVNADIHMGRFEDHKYVRELRDEFAGDGEPAAKPSPAPATTGEALRSHLGNGQVETLLPASPEEPPHMAKERDAAMEKFFARPSYRIDPERCGWPNWDRHVLSAFRYAAEHKGPAEFNKLRADIRNDHVSWEQTRVATKVGDWFLEQIDEIEQKMKARLSA